MNRYPDPDATLLRRRLAERYETEPGRVAVGNGSCEILLAAAEALCEPGRRDRLRLAGLLDVPVPAGADRRPRDPRAARRGRRPRPRRDGGRGDRGDPAADRLQPEQPDRDPPPGGRDRRLLRADPAARDGRSSTRPTSSSRPTTTPTRPLDLLADFPNLVVLRTFSKCYGLAGLRVGYAIGSPKFRAAVDAVRQPFSVNALAQAAGAEAILHQDDVLRAGRERRSPSASRSRRGCAELGLRDRRHPGQLLLDRPRRRRRGARSSPASPSARSPSAPATPLGGPGHIRVSYGTAGGERALPARPVGTTRLNARAWYNLWTVRFEHANIRDRLPSPAPSRAATSPTGIGDLARRPARRPQRRPEEFTSSGRAPSKVRVACAPTDPAASDQKVRFQLVWRKAKAK